MKFEIIFYETSTQNPVKDFIVSLDEKTQLKIVALLEALENNPFGLKEFSKKLTANLYELRLQHLKKWIRIIYSFEKNRIIILLHGFIKKENKTPKREIENAEKRLNDFRGKR